MALLGLSPNHWWEMTGTLSWSVCLSFSGAATFLAFSSVEFVADRLSSALVKAVDKSVAPVFKVVDKN